MPDANGHIFVPDANGRIRGIAVPELPWKQHSPDESLFNGTTLEEREQYYAELSAPRPTTFGPVTDESIHQALCVEEGCSRCSR